jgi:hypothetical protein
MERFDQDTLFDRLAERGQLDIAVMGGLAEAIVRLHAAAEPRADHGGRDGMAWVIDGNALGISEQSGGDRAVRERLAVESRAALDRDADLLEARRRDGLVRLCHGDLHLRNICLVDDAPTLFDAVEFNDQISCIDVLYDLAFLLMDLWRRNLRPHANTVLNEYLVRTNDLQGLRLLPLFLSCRAAVRAKTSISAAKVQSDERRTREMEIAAHDYLAMALDLLHPPAPCLIAIGGFSGSGKSTLARRLAPVVGGPPGALIVRSDVIRKGMFGVHPHHRLGPDAYESGVTRCVYQTMTDRVRTALEAGHSAIADAVFARQSDREGIAATARAAGVPFVGLWIDGPPDVLARRLTRRGSDASDATVDVLHRQLVSGADHIDWLHVDGSQDVESVRRGAEALLMPSTSGCFSN